MSSFKQLIYFFFLNFLFFNVMSNQAMNNPNNPNIKSVVFAGGCFWCMEKPFDELQGVVSTTSGYSGDLQTNATYPQVSSGATKHREVIEITYDSSLVNFQTLIELFWLNVDPFDDGGQFCDRGYQYQSAVYYENENEKIIAEQTKNEIEKKFDRGVKTKILEKMAFYPAEDYHQNYYKTNPIRYKYYRYSCGRDARLKAIWGDLKNK